MLSSAMRSLTVRLFQQQQCQPVLQRLSSTSVYSWTERGNGAANHQWRQSNDGESPRYFNEIRLRGTITRVQQSNNKICRFVLKTNQLYKRVNPGGSWRWAESTIYHNVFGAGEHLPNFLPAVSVGARVDLSAMVVYRTDPGAGAEAGAGAGAGADADAQSAPGATDASAPTRQAQLRLMWIKPVVEEESVDVNFGVQLEDL